jgi:hypothetical protein
MKTNLETLQEVIALVAPVAAQLTEGLHACVGVSADLESGGPEFDELNSFALYSERSPDDDATELCGTTTGYLLILRADGSLWGAITHGRYWFAGSSWMWMTSGPLARVTVEEAACHVNVVRVQHNAYAALCRLRGRPLHVAWRRARLAARLRGGSTARAV